MGILIPDKELLKDIRRVAIDLGRSPLISEYERLGKYSTITLRNRFGGWSDILQMANLPKTSSHRTYWTDEDLQNELNRLEEALGHKPSYKEIKESSRISPDTFKRRLGCDHFVDFRNEANLTDDWDIDKIPEDIGNWIAGFVDGEGSFILRKQGDAAFKVGIRADDIDTLKLLKLTFGVKNKVAVYSNKNRRIKGEKVGDEARFQISNRHNIKTRVIPFFDRFQLRSKKAIEYAIFREFVLYLCQRDEEGRYGSRRTPEEKKILSDMVSRLQAIRKDISKAILT